MTDRIVPRSFTSPPNRFPCRVYENAILPLPRPYRVVVLTPPKAACRRGRGEHENTSGSFDVSLKTRQHIFSTTRLVGTVDARGDLGIRVRILLWKCNDGIYRPRHVSLVKSDIPLKWILRLIIHIKIGRSLTFHYFKRFVATLSQKRRSADTFKKISPVSTATTGRKQTRRGLNQIMRPHVLRLHDADRYQD